MSKPTYEELIYGLRHAHNSLRTFTDYVPENEKQWTTFDNETLDLIENLIERTEEV